MEERTKGEVIKGGQVGDPVSWQVLREVRSSYPNLTILGDINIAKSAALKTR